MESFGFLVVCSVMFSQGVQGWYYTTEEVTGTITAAQPSCRYNCGQNLGNCSCSSSCRSYGNCCYDYYAQCPSSAATATTTATDMTTAQPSCRYNCGRNLGNCSCSTSCAAYGNCCYDFNTQCPSYVATTARPSCRYNCGRDLGSCSCSSSCRSYGNCCYDFNSQCPSYVATTAQPSCRYNCGRDLGSCSCSSSCRSYGNCCYDFNSQCPSYVTTTAQPSCRYNCGRDLGSCSCSSSCRSYGNCCYDFNSQCPSYVTTTARPSCRYNCGRDLGSCSCSSSCGSYGNCCYDFNSQCPSYVTTTAQPSCRYNCGRDLGSCSCSSSCRSYGNCCYDFNSFCYSTSPSPVFSTAVACGGSLSGSGSFSSPGYPAFYHDNSYCVWHLRASPSHRIYLSVTDLQLENCCDCDYVAVYDGSGTYSPLLGKLCNNTLNFFQSSSTAMTVVFRADSSIVGRGFNAEFLSSVTPDSGRVTCLGDNMNIVIEKSYLSSLGYVGDNLYLNDDHCRPQISAYQVTFSFPINTCGTVRKFKAERVVYSNALRAYKSNYGVITRQSTLKLNVDCRMEPDTTVQLLYVAESRENSTITGTGRFNGSMAFYTSASFHTMISEDPYKVALNAYLYVQVKLRREDNLLHLFLDSCVASPSAHDFHSTTYDLVRNGCGVDNTYYSYTSGTQSVARFRFQAFQFLRTHESVYLQCKVVVCQAADITSRCRRGCNRRRARALRAAEDSHTLVLGPVTLEDLESQDKGSVVRSEEVEPKKPVDV